MPVRRKAIIAATMLGAVGIGGVVGAVALAPAVSGAASSTTTAPSSNAQGPAGNTPGGGGYGTPPANFDPTKGGHVANGITEELLTGDTATKVSDAALAAVPGGTIQRVETDAEGATYEAHMTKADGTMVTVKVDANFKVTSVENGPR